jgi:hypothetical protein
METHAASSMKSALNSMHSGRMREVINPGDVLHSMYSVVSTRTRRPSLNYGVENDFNWQLAQQNESIAYRL